MKKPSAIKPFLTSITYLSREAKRMNLEQVAQICRTAEKQLSNHLIDELLMGAHSKKLHLTKSDYENIREFLMCVVRTPPKELKKFQGLLERESEIYPDNHEIH